MKKYLSMAALVLVGAVMTGCSSSDDLTDNTQPQQPENTSNVVTLTTTVSLGGDGATRALTSTGVKTFAAGETMALCYWNTSGNWVKAVSNALKAGDIADGSKSATFTFTLTDPKKSGPVVYIYPAAIVKEDGDVDNDALFNNQDGTLAKLASTFDYSSGSGAWDGDNLPSVTLENQLAILAITLKDEAGTSEITGSITGLTLSDGTNTYNVSRSAAAGPIYVAIYPTASATIDITATSGTKNYTKTLTGKTYAKGNGYPVNWKMTEVVDPNLLSGKFSVSSTKKVKFSKGNLRYASGTWSFFDNQYDYYTSYSADAWDKFGWSSSANNYGMSTSQTSSDYSGDFVDWGATMGMGTGWFTLTSDEWAYLFNTRSASTVGSTANGRYAKGKVNDVQGIILFPDTYTHPDGVTAPVGVNATDDTGWNGNNYSSADWTKMESAGCVFLPAAGYRNGSSVSVAGTSGIYRSATPNGLDNAYNVDFYSGDLNPAADGYVRGLGFSVRLVHAVE